jgi:hypothetical protein
LRGLSGLVLIPSCILMSRRIKIALTWYMCMWPINFLTASYAAFVRQLSIHAPKPVLLAIEVTFLAVILLVSMLFYIHHSSKVIFDASLQVQDNNMKGSVLEK